MKKTVRAVRMFLEYLQVNPAERDSYHLFRNFAQRLYTGTASRDTGIDPSGLCWSPHSPQDAGSIIIYLTDFFDWLGEKRPAAAQINPRYTGGLYDRITDEAAYQYRRNRAFLGHTWATNADSDETGHRVRARRLPMVNKDNPPAFPEERFMDLLFQGFRVGEHYDYRGMLITLLLHGAGFRESEPFHLYIEDVWLDPANERQAMVRIHHPCDGYAPADWRDALGKPKQGNRKAYLAEKFGLSPRTELMDSRAAGWKGGMHDAAYFKQAHWFPFGYGELFMQLWRPYLAQVAAGDARNHPFAFVNLRRAPIGGMYCVAQYLKAHAAACKRIGLTVAKESGSTPHGHRHAYARRLNNAGIDKALIRVCMHHASIESQDVYNEPTAQEVRAALDAGTQRLGNSIEPALIPIPILNQ
jgi:hypothetical protein